MVSLRLFILILVTLACREIGEPVPTRTFSEALIASAGIALGFGLAFKALTLGSLLRLSDAATGISSAHETLRSRVTCVWIAVLPVTFFTTGIGQWIATLSDAYGLKFVALACWFLPSIAVLLLMELTTAQHAQIVAEHNTPNKRAVPDWKPRFWDQLRHGDLLSLAICLFPVAATTCILDLLALVGVQSTGPAAASLVSAATLGCFLVSLPWLLARRVGAEYVSESPMTQRAERYLKSAGLRGVSVRITADSWHGAAIVGFVPGFRQLWLSEALAEHLSDEEVDMVIMHELAHVRRLHFLVRLSPILAAAAVLAIVLSNQDLPALFGLHATTSAAVAKVSSVIAATVCLLAGVSWAARRCEFDADRFACRLAQRHCSWTQHTTPESALAAALVKLIGDDASATRTTWLHPSLRDRLANLALPTAEQQIPSITA
ncbi:MAG: M48 family metalloprotease [Aureliella sp.]